MTIPKLPNPTYDYYVLLKDTPEYLAGAVFRKNTEEFNDKVSFEVIDRTHVKKTSKYPSSYNVDEIKQTEWFRPVEVKFTPLNEKKP